MTYFETNFRCIIIDLGTIRFHTMNFNTSKICSCSHYDDYLIINIIVELKIEKVDKKNQCGWINFNCGWIDDDGDDLFCFGWCLFIYLYSF